MSVQVGDTATYRGRRWRVIGRRPDLGPGWVRLGRRDTSVMGGWRTVVAQADGLTDVEPLALEPGQAVTVGLARVRGTVVEFAPGESVTVERPEERRRTRLFRLWWKRDAGLLETSPGNINI